MKYDRSGIRIGTIKLGRWNCLRQEWMIPGEAMELDLSGGITMAALREPISLKVHATLAAFYTPMRFITPDGANFPAMVKEGLDNTTLANSFMAYTVPTASTPAGVPWDALGVGHIEEGDEIAQFWVRNYLDIYNWYMRWPEDAEHAIASLKFDSSNMQWGFPAVSLESYATRLRTETLDDADLTVEGTESSGTTSLNLRVLAAAKSRLRSEVTRDWWGRRGYNETVQSIWGTWPSENVEERPFLIGKESAWLSGGNIHATDGDNLGRRAGLMQMNFAQDFGTFTAPEHGVISYWLTLRVPPIYIGQANPLLGTDDWTYDDWIMEPSRIAALAPQSITRRKFLPGTTDDIEGLHPRGQHQRTGWHQIDGQIATRDSFPVYKTPATVASLKYHQDMDHAFVSQAYGHGLMSVEFNQVTSSPLPPPAASIMAGT